MARQPYPERHQSTRVASLVAGSPKLNLVRMMSHSEGTVEAVLRLSDGVLNCTQIDPVLRQIALLRLCVIIPSEYEFTLLTSVSRRYGMADEVIEAAREGSECGRLTDLQRTACRLAEELAVQPRASSATFDALQAALGPRGVAELVTAIGFYLMQSRFIETFEIEPEDPPIDLSGPETEALRAWREGRQ